MSRPELKNYVPTNLSPLPHETVSILLSTDRRDLERVMVDNLIEKVDEKKGTFLFTSQNTAFLGLEHYTRVGKGLKLGLKIGDPEGKVMNKLLSPSFELVSEFEKKRVESYKNLKSLGEVRAGVSSKKVLQEKDAILSTMSIDSAALSRENLKFYIAYGMGSDARYWAGPFILHLFEANYTYNDMGIATLELSFLSDISYEAQITFRENDVVLPTNPLFMTASVPSTTKTKIGTLDDGIFNTSTEPTIDFFSDMGGVEGGIIACHKKWTQSFGIDNFIHIYPKDIFDSLNTNLPSTFGGGVAMPGDTTLNYLKKELKEYGFNVSIEEKTVPKAGKTLVETKLNYDVYLDIDEYYKSESSPGEGGGEANFLRPFQLFWDKTEQISGKTLNFELYQDSNIEQLNMIKEFSTYGAAITKDDAPLFVLAERSAYQKEIWDGGVSLNLPTHNPTEDTYKQKINEYLENKLLNSPSPSIYLGKALDNLHDGGDFHKRLDGYEGTYGLSIEDLSDKDKEGISSRPLPVFEANTPNSNILSYSLDQQAMSFASMTRNLGTLPTKDEGRMKSLIKQELGGLASRYPGSKYLEETGREFDLDGIVDNMMGSLFGGTGNGLDFSDTNPDTIFDRILPYLRFFWNLSIVGGTRGTIKTLPMFTLSDNAILRQLCVINIFKNPTIKSTHESLELYNTTYSGVYNIIGFNHVINGVETYSEFDVLKLNMPPKQKMKQTDFKLGDFYGVLEGDSGGESMSPYGGGSPNSDSIQGTF